jgi:hypothetical protein
MVVNKKDGFMNQTEMLAHMIKIGDYWIERALSMAPEDLCDQSIDNYLEDHHCEDFDGGEICDG